MVGLLLSLLEDVSSMDRRHGRGGISKVHGLAPRGIIRWLLQKQRRLCASYMLAIISSKAGDALGCFMITGNTVAVVAVLGER